MTTEERLAETRWTQFMADAEVDHYGTKRLVNAHNLAVALIEKQRTTLDAYRERLGGSTHWEGCEDAHPICAAEKALATLEADDETSR